MYDLKLCPSIIKACICVTLTLLSKVGMLQKIIFLTFSISLLALVDTYGQSTREPDKAQQFQSNVQSTSKKKKKSKKNNYKAKMDLAVKEYEELMKANVKKKAKIAKEMEKPQYSDPSYFGHKKKPKKRPLSKRKMCKECGIVH